MIHIDHVILCDDCGSQMVHGICTLCGHRDLENSRESEPRELDFNTDLCYAEWEAERD